MKLCEIYLQEVLYAAYTQKLRSSTMTPELESKNWHNFLPATLRTALGFINSGILHELGIPFSRPETVRSMEMWGDIE